MISSFQSFRRRRTLVAMATLCICSFAITSQAAAATPAWHISQMATPTNLVPGSAAPATSSAIAASPQYSLLITNVGAAATTGPITIEDRLPPGIAPSAVMQPEVRNHSFSSEFHACAPPLGQIVMCTITGTVEPGADVDVSIPVDVSSTAPSQVVNQVTITGGGAQDSAGSLSTDVSASVPSFGFLPGAEGLFAAATDEDGLPADGAGSHPFNLVIETHLPAKQVAGRAPGQDILPVEPLRNLEFELPPGLVVDPQATPSRCTEAQLQSRDVTEGKGCPPASQVGVVRVLFGNLGGVEPFQVFLYNMEPPFGSAAELGFNVSGTLVHVQGGVDNAFHLTADSREILAKIGVIGLQATIWGNPSDPRHDFQRFGAECSSGCSVPSSTTPFLTMPTSCGSVLSLGASASSWIQPTGSAAQRTEAHLTSSSGEGVILGECARLSFAPRITAKPTTDATDSPSGLEFHLYQEQKETFEHPAFARLKDIKVSLAPSMSLNPSAANGRQACDASQIGLLSGIGGQPIRFSEAGQGCPAASKLGTVEVTTPLLSHALPGGVYLAKPFDNPFGSLLAMYLVVEDEETGILVKLAGRVEPNATDGQLTAIFQENPDLPLEDVALHLFGGDRAPLTTPIACGPHDTDALFTPWSAPEAPSVSGQDTFFTSRSPAGGCVTTEQQAPATFGFLAGTSDPMAGAYSSFTLHIARSDGTQRLAALETRLPEGLLGRLAGVPYCSDAAIAYASSLNQPLQGALEQASPSCGAASEIGRVAVGAGSGPAPVYANGVAYLAGPYKGAPLSLAIMTPAIAGPFDLGNVVTRVALYVEPYSAQIRAVSDPLPTILQGIPLDVRSVSLTLSRPDFVVNPTSCDPKSVDGSASTLNGTTVPLSQYFQVGRCESLRFKPHLNLTLTGQTKRAGHPALKAVVTYPRQGAYANIARAQVGLPPSEFLDQGNLDNVCRQADLMAGTCPRTSVYGHAKAWSPLLEHRLEGPVYLGVGFGYKLPALVADLNGQVRILLKGRVDSTPQNGIRNTFETVPDAPVSRFVLELKGGRRYGLFQNSEDICRTEQRANAVFRAQNGLLLQSHPLIRNRCTHRARHR